MARLARAAVVAATLGGSICALALASPADTLIVEATPDRAGSRPVRLTLALRTELQCGRLRGRRLTVRLPADVRVPHTIPAATVRVAGVGAKRVRVAGHTLTIELPQPDGATCDVLAESAAKIVFTRAANLGNPRVSGIYRVTLVQGGKSTAARLAIR